MKVKLTIAQYKQFNAEVPWPDHLFIEDDIWTVNGVVVSEDEGFDESKYDDTDIVVLEDGNILTYEVNQEKPKFQTLAAWVKSWLKSKSETVYQVTVDNQYLGAFEHFAGTLMGVKSLKKV